MTGEADLSIVIITKDRCRQLLETLSRIRHTGEPWPVIVVDNGSADGTVEALSQATPWARCISLANNRGAAGRNLGVAASHSRYVAFCDDDTWWEPGALVRAVEFLDRHQQVVIVTARTVVEPAGVDDPICEELARSPIPRPDDLDTPALVSFLAGASVVRRDAFCAAGGFSEQLVIGGEEELLAADLLAVGWSIAYDASLIVHHDPSVLRDADLRRVFGIRNTLWFTWARRPLRSALVRTARLIAVLPRDRVSARGLLAAIGGIGWVLRNRRVVPPSVEAMFRLVDRDQFRSRARQYVS